MTRSNQTQILDRLKAATDLDTRHALALNLLDVSLSRQMVDEALYALERVTLTEDDRPILRAKAAYYFEHDDRDSGALIREKLIRLLTKIGHPDDGDLYLRGVRVYEPKPVTDVAQTCRAAALIGLAGVDRALCCIHATRLLGEPDTSQLSGEPSLTAVAVLARFDERLPLYHFLLRQGESFTREGKGEVIGRALESIGPDFPAAVYGDLARSFLKLDAPAASAGIINHIVENRVAALYPLLQQLLDDTRHADLHYYGLVTLAATRDDTLTRLLYERAATCSKSDVPQYREAVELTAHPDREKMLALLEKRC
jgi:hypothetical protein